MHETSPQLSDQLLSNLYQSLELLEEPRVVSLITLEVSTQSEPTDNDLNELDQLLAKSVAIKHKTKARQSYEKVRDCAQAPFIQFQDVESIGTWQRTQCACGEIGPSTFIRWMVKKVAERGKLTHWEQRAEAPKELPVRHAIKTHQVTQCELCSQIDPSTMGELADAFK